MIPLTTLLLLCSIFVICASSRLKHTFEKFSRKFHTNSVKVSFPTPIVPTLSNVENKINKIVSSNNINAVRFRHIQLETKQMAEECKKLLYDPNPLNRWEFSALASNVSQCELSKTKGGEFGWQTVNSVDSSIDYNNTAPLELINESIHMNKGDVVIVSSVNDKNLERWHLLQLLDVSTRLSPSLIKRKADSMKLHHNGKKDLKYVIETMGCQMNVADSERIEGQLHNLGYTRSIDGSDSSIVIINTCSIRDHAEQKVYSYLGPYAQRKRSGDEVSIIIAGCVAQQEGQNIIKRFPEVDIVMGPQYSNRLI